MFRDTKGSITLRESSWIYVYTTCMLSRCLLIGEIVWSWTRGSPPGWSEVARAIGWAVRHLCSDDQGECVGQNPAVCNWYLSRLPQLIMLISTSALNKAQSSSDVLL